MRIGLFTDTYKPEINGVVSSILTLQSELEAHGHEVFIITTKASLISTSSMEGNVLKLPGLELKKLYGYVATQPLHLLAIDKIEKMNLDLIHVHTEFGVGMFARIVAKQLSIPIVSTYHTVYEDYTHYVNRFDIGSIENIAKKLVINISKRLSDTCTSVIAPSIKTKQMLLDYNVKTNIYVVPTGLDLSSFSQQNIDHDIINELRTKYKLDDYLSVVYVGRLAQEKSIDILIEAFKIINERNIKAKLFIVGAGPDDDKLKMLVSKYGLENCVIFLGKIEREKIANYYHAFDYFVSASITETQGMTFIEALASGLLILARRDEVLDDLILENENGIYFKDSLELSNIIETLIDNKIDHKEVCINSVKQYDSKTFYNEIMKVYHKTIDEYENYYNLDSIKVNGYTSIVTLVNQSNHAIKLTLPNAVIYDKGLRKNVKLSIFEIEDIKQDQNVHDAYEQCIKLIAKKDRTIKEIYDYLTDNTTIEIRYINQIIEELEEKNYLNDYNYCVNYILNSFVSYLGIKKIRYNLRKAGVNIKIIDQAIEKLSKDEYSEHKVCLAYANKYLKQLSDLSLYEAKKKLRNRLISKQYDNEVIDTVISELDFSKITLNEIDSLRKQAKKLYNIKKNKYKSTALRNIIFKSLIAKGYEYEHIYLILNEMEWDDE